MLERYHYVYKDKKDGYSASNIADTLSRLVKKGGYAANIRCYADKYFFDVSEKTSMRNSFKLRLKGAVWDEGDRVIVKWSVKMDDSVYIILIFMSLFFFAGAVMTCFPVREIRTVLNAGGGQTVRYVNSVYASIPFFAVSFIMAAVLKTSGVVQTGTREKLEGVAAKAFGES